MNFGGVMETVVTSHEFSLEKAREVLKNETIAVIGYGIQGPGQACNLRDNGFNVIVGQRQGKTYEKCLKDGWVPGKTLFSIEEAAEKGTIICMLLSDAGQIACWPKIKPHLTAGKTLYYSHGFAINWSDRTGVVPPKDIDVIHSSVSFSPTCFMMYSPPFFSTPERSSCTSVCTPTSGHRKPSSTISGTDLA